MSGRSGIEGARSAALVKDGWRRNLNVIWLATFASLLGQNLALPFIPLFVQRDLGVTSPGEAAVWSGMATAATGLAMAVMAPIWGMMADRRGRKAMLVRAQFALALANVASAVVLAPWQLVGIRAVQGGFSGVVGAARALVAGTVPRERVPHAMGMIQAAIFLGQTLGPAVGGVMGSALGFRPAFFVTAGINGAAGILAWLYVKEAPPDGDKPHATLGHTGAATGAVDAPGGAAWVLRSRPLATMVGVLFLSTAAMTSIRPVLPLLLAILDPNGDPATTSGLAFAVLGMAGAVAALATGRAGARIGLGRLLVVSAACGGAINLAIAPATAPGMILGLLALVGLCQGTLSSCTAALVSLHAPPGRQGTVFGVLTSGQALALGVGPLTGGLIGSAVGLGGTFALAGSLLLVAAALGWTVPPPPRSWADPRGGG